MRKKDKNREINSSDFLRYRRGEMTDVERNAFERILQRDPFAEEAAEGFSDFSADDAESDLKKLAKQLEKRTSGKSRMIYYRIAASVAVLMILSSVFIVLEKTRPSRQLNDLSQQQSYIEITEPKAITVPVPEKAGPEEKSGAGYAGRNQVALRAEKSVIPKKQDTETQTSDRYMAASEKKQEALPRSAVKDLELNVSREKAAALAQPMITKSSSGFLVRGKVISAEDNLPLPGATVKLEGSDKAVLTDKDGNFAIVVPSDTGQMLIAQYIGMVPQEFSAKSNREAEVKMAPDITSLSEVVVVGYGTARNSGISEDETPGYQPPAPVDGRNSFNKYIEDNIRKPSTLTDGKKAVVVLSFEIRSTGVIDSIKVIRSPDKIYSDEAIRLIREGPRWKPATSGGKNIDDEVRLRIVFK